MKRLFYIVFLAVLFSSCEKSISDYQSQNFIKFYGNGYESKGYDVINLSGGGYAFAGYDKSSMGNYQIFAAKVDNNGNTIWSKTWGNSNREEGKVIKEVADGFLIAGTTLNSSSGITHSFLLKVSLSGDSLWCKEYGGTNTSIIINDILLTENNIFLAGKSYTVNENKSDCYISKLDLLGTLVWERKNYEGTNSSFQRVFLQDDNILLAGTTYDIDGIYKVTIVPMLQSSGIPTFCKIQASDVNQYTEDALNINANHFVLVNESVQSTKNFKILKFNSGYQEEWRTETINAIEGKSFALKEDGTIIVCGEQVVETNSEIHFYKIESNGSMYKGGEISKTFSGNVGRVIETKDKGIILVGTTSSTYGTMVQLIKTDKDLFLLKP